MTRNALAWLAGIPRRRLLHVNNVALAVLLGWLALDLPHVIAPVLVVAVCTAALGFSCALDDAAAHIAAAEEEARSRTNQR